jgi:hypothetical protein
MRYFWRTIYLLLGWLFIFIETLCQRCLLVCSFICIALAYLLCFIVCYLVEKIDGYLLRKITNHQEIWEKEYKKWKS